MYKCFNLSRLYVLVKFEHHMNYSPMTAVICPALVSQFSLLRVDNKLLVYVALQ